MVGPLGHVDRGGAVVLVVIMAGLVGWRQYDAAQRAAASAAYSAALAKIAQDPAAARAEFDKQASSAPEPYRSLAAMIAAQLREPLDAQVTALVALAPTLSSAELADLANVIAAFKSVDSPKAEEMVAKLEPLAAPDRPFRLSVRELQALVAARKGDLKRARELWTEISKDPQAAAGHPAAHGGDARPLRRRGGEVGSWRTRGVRSIPGSFSSSC